MKKLLVLFVSFIVLLGSAVVSNAALFDYTCKTKYPIVLVHGAFFRDKNMLGINYWWGIDKALKDKGAQVYVSNQDPFNGVNPRTQQLANELAYQYKLWFGPLWGFSKINIIAHSMGPLDSRNLISNYAIPGVCAAGSCNSKIASLTSIAGTHKGSQVADLLYWAQNNIPILGPVVGDMLEGLIDLFGETFELAKDQNTKLLLHDLTSDFAVNTFNPNTPNKPGVLYESYAGKINHIDYSVDPIGQPIVDLLYTVMNLMGAGPNDGLVSVESAKWGTFKGIIPSDPGSVGVNHFYEINQFIGMTPGFDAEGFYVGLAKSLKARGY